MHLFIDQQKKPTVYTNLFGKKIKRDFYNSRMAARMDGQFSGKLLLKNKKSTQDGFDAYSYRNLRDSESEVHIYDDTVNSFITPGKVADAAEKVMARLGRGFVRRVYIAERQYSEDTQADAVITKDIAILNGSRSLSKSQIRESLYIHGLCNLCDCAVKQNDEHDSPFFYETSSRVILKNCFDEHTGSLLIGKNAGWYFAHITEDIFKDKPFQQALQSAEKIIVEMKNCAEGKDFSFARTAIEYFKDQEGLMRNNYDYYIVMKRLTRLNPMSQKLKMASKRWELDRIIGGIKPRMAE